MTFILIVGSIVAKVKLVTDVSVKFRLLSNGNLFSIDDNGQISLTNQLDREKAAFYVIGILAYTDSSPPLTALSEVYLQVIDSNDNVPNFENEIYSISIAENMPEGTSVIKGRIFFVFTYVIYHVHLIVDWILYKYSDTYY